MSADFAFFWPEDLTRSFTFLPHSLYQYIMSDSCCLKCIYDGVYDGIVEQFKAMGSTAFAGASYGPVTSDSKQDFFRQ